MRYGEHRVLRKQVLESPWLQDTIRAVDSTAYGPGGKPKDSVDQDSNAGVSHAESSWLFCFCSHL